jgi:hypothetical protein
MLMHANYSAEQRYSLVLSSGVLIDVCCGTSPACGVVVYQ